MLTAWLYWNPSKNAFTIPVLDRPIAWYGILFVLGFIFSYFIIIPVFARFLSKSDQYSGQPFPHLIESTRQKAQFLADRLCWFVVIGTVVGARLGAVFFYDWEYYRAHPSEIVKVWHGGLASHGGVIGILVAVYLFRQHVKKWVPSLTFIDILDTIAVPTGLAAGFIRLGNFVNQEILGLPTTMPWGVVFGHPVDGSLPIPRHPVQLYEALSYFSIFFVIFFLWKNKSEYLTRGTLSGLLLILVFSSRFVLEFWKEHQASILDLSSIQMGQWLSLPMIALGIYLIWYGRRSSCAYPKKDRS